MCDERRAFFQKVSFMGAEPKAGISINPTLWQWWVWLGGTLVAIVVGLWAGISFVSANVFEEKLLDFHEVAKPEIRQIIAEEIEHHEAVPAHSDVIQRIESLETHKAAVDVRVEEWGGRLKRIEDKVDILISNGSDH